MAPRVDRRGRETAAGDPANFGPGLRIPTRFHGVSAGERDPAARRRLAAKRSRNMPTASGSADCSPRRTRRQTGRRGSRRAPRAGGRNTRSRWPRREPGGLALDQAPEDNAITEQQRPCEMLDRLGSGLHLRLKPARKSPAASTLHAERRRAPPPSGGELRSDARKPAKLSEVRPCRAPRARRAPPRPATQPGRCLRPAHETRCAYWRMKSATA